MTVICGPLVVGAARCSSASSSLMRAVDAARSILPIGSSERPGSPMRTVNYASWAEGDLHPAPVTRKAVQRYAETTKVLVP